MTQKDYVVQAMKSNGGYATFNELYHLVDFSSWGTQTPQASVRRIVQTNKEFFRIEAGLWGLNDYKEIIHRKFNIQESNEQSSEIFSHSYYQGIIATIGNLRQYYTYVPPQDKNRLFIDKKLSDVASVSKIFDFTYPELVGKAKTVDVIWFNERRMPQAFYEVEHTTNIRNSLDKFFELQDFRAKFYIVAPKERERQFENCISLSIYRPIKNYVTFVNYDNLVRQYDKESIIVEKAI